MSTEERKEFEKLLALVGERTFTEEEFARLNSFLKKEPTWADEYYEHCYIQGLLEEKNGALAGKDELELLFANQEVSTSPEPKAFPKWIFAVAACLAAAIIIISNRGPADPGFIAEIKSGIDQQLYNQEGAPLSLGDKLKPGKYTLQKGLTELNYADGIKVVLEAPAKFEVINKDEMKLNSGKVYALTPPGAKGFTITTPKAIFNDLGTEFAVEYEKNKSTTLFVFKGKVQAIAYNGLEKILTDGQGLTLGNSGKMKNLVIREDYFVRQLPKLENSYQKMVASLSPVVYLPMEKDKSGQFYNYSTFSPGSVQVANDKTVRGVVGKSFRSNNDNYLQIGAYPKATESISICGWIKIDGETSGIVARNGNNRGKGQFSIILEKGVLKSTMLDRHGNSVVAAPVEALTPDEWQHFTFVYDGTNAMLYINSKLTAAKSNAEGVFTENPLPYVSVGSNSQEESSFNGAIDEFAIFNKALTADEIKMLYNVKGEK